MGNSLAEILAGVGGDPYQQGSGGISPMLQQYAQLAPLQGAAPMQPGMGMPSQQQMAMQPMMGAMPGMPSPRPGFGSMGMPGIIGGAY